MKTPEEWIKAWYYEEAPANFRGFINNIQQEAFLEGQLKGLEDGKQATMKVIDEVLSKPAV